MFDVVELLYYLIPTAALAFFAVSLAMYLHARRKNKRQPGSYTEAQLRQRRICLIVASIIAGMTAATVIIFFCLLLVAVAFM